MATRIASLFASLDLQSASFLNGLRDATRATDRAANSIDQAMSRASTAVKGFVAVWAANNAIQGAQKMMEMADAGKKLEGQLRLATQEFGTYGQAQKDVQRIAAETRADLNETGALYAKNARGVKELGGTQQQAALMTENFNKALKVGNANQNEAASAMLAWGQAMNSGKMEGEDYNSIIDASPPLIEALARSLGKPIGAMKKLVEDGKVTAQVMVDALTKPEYTKKLIDDFEQVPRTWEETATLIENQAQTLVSSFDRGSGLSNAIVDLFQSGSDGATDMAKVAEDKGIEMRADYEATAAVIRSGFEALEDAFEPLRSAAEWVFGDIRQQALSTRDYVASLFKVIDDFRNAPADMALSLRDNIKNKTGIEMPRNWFVPDDMKRSDIAGTYTRNYDASSNQRAQERNMRVFRDSLPANQRFRPEETADWLAGRGRFAPQTKPKPRPAPASGGGSGSKPRGGGSGSRGKTAEQLAREAEQQATRDRRDALAFANDLGRAESDLIGAKAQLTTVTEERYTAERKQLELEFAERARALKEDGPEGSKRYTQAQVDQLANFDAQIKAAREAEITRNQEHDLAEERQKLAAASLQNAIDLASSDGDLARTARDRRASQLRILDLSYQQEKLALDAIVASNTATEAEKQIAQARLAILDKLKAGETRKIERSTQSPAQQWLADMPQTAGEISESLESAAVDGLDNLKGGLLDCIKGAGDLGDAFSSMADTVIDGLLDIALQQMLIKPLGNLLFGGGSGGSGGLLGSLIGGISKGLSGNPLGGKANGGMGNNGSWLVGEHGPEIIDVGGPFNVIPTTKLKGVRGSGGSSINVSFGSIVSNDPIAVKAMALQAVAEMAPIIAQQASDKTMGRLQRPRM